MKNMKALTPIFRDKMMIHGIHVYNGQVVTIPTAGLLYYSGYGTCLFTCEMFYDFILLGYYGNTQIGIDTLKLYLTYQRSDGFLLRSVSIDERINKINPFFRFEQNEHAQPFLFQMVLLLARMRGGDLAWLSEAEYEGLCRYLRHWQRYWVRDDSGLCVWNSAQHGMSDNAFDRAGSWRSLFCQGVGLACYLTNEYLAAAEIAKALGKNQDADGFLQQAQAMKERVQTYLWNEEDGFFYDRDARTGKPIRIKHCHCFDVIAYGLATEEQVKRMVEEHLQNPEEFWTAYPIPSYAKNEPNYIRHYVPAEGAHPYHYMYEGHPNWRGGMWPHSGYSLVHGLRRYGYHELADELTCRYEELVEKNPLLYEWYDAEDGTGKGGTPFCAGVQMLLAFLRAEKETGANPYLIRPVSEPFENEMVAEKMQTVPIPARF